MMKNAKAPVIVTAQYVIAFVIMAVNLAAHFLFLLGEAGVVTLHVGEWAQGWFALYTLIWSVVLAYVCILSAVLRDKRLVSNRVTLPMLVLNLVITAARMIVYAVGRVLFFYEWLSWGFAVLMLVMLVLYVREIIVSGSEKRG